jgi:competence ComEA-like helix-hairpin-helix protein
MQQLEKTISLFAISGIILSLSLNYSFKVISSPRSLLHKEKDSIQTALNSIKNSKIVNINTADRYTLSKLPGIGIKLSERIIEYRNTNGPFSCSYDIMKVKGIGSKKYALFSKSITTGPEDR